jgi:hypothetical protein
MAKARVHRFVLTVTMDQKCTRKTALREVRDNIHGQHYCTTYQDDDPESFRVKSIGRLAVTKAAPIAGDDEFMGHPL